MIDFMLLGAQTPAVAHLHSIDECQHRPLVVAGATAAQVAINRCHLKGVGAPIWLLSRLDVIVTVEGNCRGSRGRQVEARTRRVGQHS